MKEIPLTKGQVALVDDEDYERLNQHKWYCSYEGRGDYPYANRMITIEPGKQIKISMHRELVETPEKMHTDHIDGDGLNNQKSNLRIVTHRQNCQNRHHEKTSKFPGVNYHYGNWRAHIRICGKQKYLGRFVSEEEAATAYRVAEAVLVNE